jgi:hypothetical protein
MRRQNGRAAGHGQPWWARPATVGGLLDDEGGRSGERARRGCDVGHRFRVDIALTALPIGGLVGLHPPEESHHGCTRTTH